MTPVIAGAYQNSGDVGILAEFLESVRRGAARQRLDTACLNHQCPGGDRAATRPAENGSAWRIAVEDPPPYARDHTPYFRQQALQQIGFLILFRTRTLAEHSEKLPVGPLVFTEELRATHVVRNFQQSGGAHLIGGGQEIVAMLGEGGVARIHDAVEVTQRLLASVTHDVVVTQISNQRSLMDLRERKGAQGEDLTRTHARVRYRAHAIFMAVVPARIARRLSEQLLANTLGRWLTLPGAMFNRALGLEHEPSLREINSRSAWHGDKR